MSEFETHMYVLGLVGICTGEGFFRPKIHAAWKRCFDTRRRRAHAALVFSLSNDLRQRFKTEIRSGDPRRLYRTLREAYEGSDSQNTTFLRNELYGRRLKATDSLQQYLYDLQSIRRILGENRARISDDELARIVLPNVVSVYPGISQTYTQWAMRHEGELDLRDANGRVENAERTYRVVTQAGQGQAPNRNGGRGLQPQAQVNKVNRDQQGRPRGARVGRGRGRGRNSSTASNESIWSIRSIEERMHT